MDGALHSYKPQAEETGPMEAPRTVSGSRGQVANAAENVVVAPWNRLEILSHILEAHKGEIAGIFLEPVLCNSGCLMPEPGYLEGVQALAGRHACLLVFDEVITGFRIHFGGAQKHFGVTPDLATFGKAVGGGVPLSVVAGRANIMEQMFTSGVAFGGTFNGNPVSLAGAAVCLEELSRDDGAALRHANRMGEELKHGIAGIAQRRGVSLQVTGFGTAFCLHFTSVPVLCDYRDTLRDDRDMLQRFLHAALSEGVNLVPDGRLYVSTAHTEEDVAETLQKLESAFAQL
jgi:glutamate-1-semialdehyde 2,1-aminomutase